MSADPQQRSQSRQRSHSRSRESRRQSRPTTPLRASSRESFRRSAQASGPSPLDALLPPFQELDDAMQTLHENFYQLHLLHESINKFNENFSSLLYGLNMNAFCVEFQERPVPESFERAKVEEEASGRARANSGPGIGGYRTDYDAETTFMTNDTFVEQPAPVAPTPAATAADKGPKPSVGGSKGPKIPVRGTKSSRVRRGASGIARGRYSTR